MKTWQVTYLSYQVEKFLWGDMLFKLQNLMIGRIACFSNDLQYRENTLVSMLVKGSLHKCHNGTCVEIGWSEGLYEDLHPYSTTLSVNKPMAFLIHYFPSLFRYFIPSSHRKFLISFFARHFWHTPHTSLFHYNIKITQRLILCVSLCNGVYKNT